MVSGEERANRPRSFSRSWSVATRILICLSFIACSFLISSDFARYPSVSGAEHLLCPQAVYRAHLSRHHVPGCRELGGVTAWTGGRGGDGPSISFVTHWITCVGSW